jgi:hypothetical protein
VTAPTCIACERPTPDGFACVACTDRARRQLAEIAELAPPARLVAAGLVRRGGGGSSGKPESRSPGNDDAMDALDVVQNTITTIARDIAETRGVQIVSAASVGARVPDPLVEAAKWLTHQLEWVRHAMDDQGGPYAGPVLAEIAECASRMRAIVNGPADRKYLGPCGVERPYQLPPEPVILIEICEGDVYGYPGAASGTCRECGAKHDQGERRAWIGDITRERAYRAAHIADAHRINVNTIRSWALRGRLLAHDEDEQGRPLYLLGDVLDLAAADAEKREAARAKREQRDKEPAT